MKNTYYWLIVIPLIISSCTSTKQLRYFNDLPDSARIELPHMAQVERSIQDGDRLSITIGAEDPEAAALFNNYGGVSASGGGASGARGGESEIVGYLVAADGTIELPYIGKTPASGLTATQFKDSLTARLSKYLKGVMVSVRFFQIKFTVLGEVRSPGTYTLPLQRTTFLDALGAAGDLPITAKRFDIQIYRDYNGKRTIFKVDLRKKDILYDSELFQVRHNDVIYVQPRDSRRFSEETRFYASFVTLAVGLIAIFTRF
ncbi:polysaccharide biosynthesis/export family protein [Pedobacter metabolipauper]|uniref:Polysaccharide export outer membrane protein n=1 Tax=Pedobacter metabolipauper TaxID=425513 RepID=A0A4V3D1A3_9SPHI|nr:polysaccharide biosynthesis/export family protein [Pedobacter metabolipauper]TDQ09917.1 polysaccharide export outer membrane protein [Pedobacter metabolipauper]